MDNNFLFFPVLKFKLRPSHTQTSPVPPNYNSGPLSTFKPLSSM